MSQRDFIAYIKYREDQACIELVKNHIKPNDAKKAKKIINAIENPPAKKKRKSTPRELVVRIVDQRPGEDYSNLTQYLL